MPLQSGLTQETAGHAGNEFRGASLDAVTDQLLPCFGSPKILFQFAERNAGLLGRQVLALSQEPDKLLVAEWAGWK